MHNASQSDYSALEISFLHFCHNNSENLEVHQKKNYDSAQSRGAIYCYRILAAFKGTISSEEQNSSFFDLLVCYQVVQDQDPVQTFFLRRIITFPTFPFLLHRLWLVGSSLDFWVRSDSSPSDWPNVLLHFWRDWRAPRSHNLSLCTFGCILDRLDFINDFHRQSQSYSLLLSSVDSSIQVYQHRRCYCQSRSCS